MARGRSAQRATDLESRVEGSGLIQAGAHPEFDKPTPLDKVVAGVKKAVAAVTPKPKPPAMPKPIGNSARDAHARRAREFQLSEADRQKQMARLDRMRAADRDSTKK